MPSEKTDYVFDPATPTIVMTRLFDTPRRLVWDAMTKPEYLKRWYYDTVNFNPHMLMMVREMIGADRMVMGSDYPHLLGSIDRAVSSIESLDISGEEKGRIFEGTAMSILNNVERL